MSFYSIDAYPGDGSTKTFALTFEFISRDSVFVYSVDDTTKVETKLAVVTSGTPGSGQYKWDSDKQITLGDALPTGTSVKIQRDTTIDLQIVQWKDGSYIIAEDLNTSDKQWLYNLQELEDHIDQLNGSFSGPAVKKITGVLPVEVDSTNDQVPEISVDLITKADAEKDPTDPTWDTEDKLASPAAIDQIYKQVVGDGSGFPGAGNKAKLGQLRVDDTKAQPEMYYWDANAGTPAWVQIQTKGDKGDKGDTSAPVVISQDTPPTFGDDVVWFNTVDAQAYFGYTDPSGDQYWVCITKPGPKGEKGDTGAGPPTTIADTAPASPGDGYVWHNSHNGRGYVYWSSQSVWVEM